MYAKASSILATLALLSSVSAQSATTPDQTVSTECPGAGGAHVVVARGSLEPPPFGVQGTVKDQIVAAFSGSNAEGLVGYPNTLQDYFVSESDGVVIARALLTDFVARCPGAPLVLLGYSQGANVFGDALLGQQDNGFPANASISTPLPDQVLSQVAALVLLGDPTFVVAENSFNAGNATRNGSFPRQNAELFNTTGLATRTRAWCDADDLFCAGGSSLIVHVSYITKYGNDIAQFAISQVKKYFANGSGSTATGSVTATASTAVATGGYATGTISGKASRTSACQSIGLKTSRATSGAVPTPTVTPSSAATPTGAVSTGAASALNAGLASAAGAGAVVAGLFAAFL